MPQKITEFSNYIRRISPFYWSISAKLLIVIFLAATIPMSLTAYNNLKLGLENLVQSESDKLEVIAVSNANRLDQFILDNRLIINQVSRNADIVKFLTVNSILSEELFSKVEKGLEIILRSSSDYDAVFIIDKDGICRVSTDPTCIGQNQSFYDYFKKAIQSEAGASISFLVEAASGRPGLFFAHPIRSDRGETLGVAVLKIQGPDVWKVINSIRVDSHVQAFLVDERGVVIAHPNNSFLYRSLNKLPSDTQKELKAKNSYGRDKIGSLNLPELAEVMVGARQIGHVSYYSPIEKTHQIAGFAPLETQSWVLGVNKPKAIFEAPMRAMIWQNGLFVLIVGGFAVIASLLLSNQLIKSIRALIKAGKALQRGEFKPESLVKIARSQDDLGRLAGVFLKMAEEINNREQYLKSQVQNLRVEIDETKKERQISEITGTEYFKDLQKKALRLKNRVNAEAQTEEEYFQKLHKKAEDQKTRFVANL
ncbi:cache domain-containing protein [Pleurocapsa sp. PCC 7319]|uniref:PDC sensor domain-containing protein n=1 Tax=Pleurocapsa sp. PCC 7319 TaxID=118161 RepID=UPI0003467F0B|nr:cache domain-containing protein [Pleurocapsa sp. PCC 7319]